MSSSGKLILGSHLLRIICSLLFLWYSFSFAQLSEEKHTILFENNEDARENRIHYSRLILSACVLSTVNYGLYQPFKEVWWQEKRTHFHLYRGYRRTRGNWDFGWHDSLYGHMDKLGHFYSSKRIAESLTELTQWIGFSDRSSRLIGPAMSFVLMLEIELYDSFFKEWGFSLGDLSANTFGCLSPILEDNLKFFNRFKLKLSYHPSEYLNNEKYYIKDYSGMTYWLSYNIECDLPEFISSYWPDFLNVALGYSVNRPDGGDIELFIGPDINWESLGGNDKMKIDFLLKFLNQIRFPCFAWQLTPRQKLYPLYF